ncbi:MAG: hypothetical protein AVDCRST_MAG77-3873, partial [uncultured Chloroflexi bacterium]
DPAGHRAAGGGATRGWGRGGGAVAALAPPAGGVGAAGSGGRHAGDTRCGAAGSGRGCAVVERHCPPGAGVCGGHGPGAVGLSPSGRAQLAAACAATAAVCIGRGRQPLHARPAGSGVVPPARGADSERVDDWGAAGMGGQLGRSDLPGALGAGRDGAAVRIRAGGRAADQPRRPGDGAVRGSGTKRGAGAAVGGGTAARVAAQCVPARGPRRGGAGGRAGGSCHAGAAAAGAGGAPAAGGRRARQPAAHLWRAGHRRLWRGGCAGTQQAAPHAGVCAGGGPGLRAGGHGHVHPHWRSGRGAAHGAPRTAGAHPGGGGHRSGERAPRVRGRAGGALHVGHAGRGVPHAQRRAAAERLRRQLGDLPGGVAERLATGGGAGRLLRCLPAGDALRSRPPATQLPLALAAPTSRGDVPHDARCLCGTVGTRPRPRAGSHPRSRERAALPEAVL